ncbi:hypothetical protein MNR01_07515 [Lysobacter sp. S4-A87]|uniref:hypothetical protein n=1 Tax=Lysobacter sp. S4-A87 TaxID=2925843 RepID=UPI001F52DF68|nr:hypothetical protein [Lysobacter sp. S4-A87]UNK50838.1 hypothetical protein MNR01_07515 [Lysobacter sp. S4-A87]
MKAKIAFIALALAASMPAWADEDPVRDLSQISGLSERKVQMILGNRTAFAEYTYTYDRALEKFVDAIGQENYRQLMNGEAVALTDKQGRVYLVQVKRDFKGAL